MIVKPYVFPAWCQTLAGTAGGSKPQPVLRPAGTTWCDWCVAGSLEFAISMAIRLSPAAAAAAAADANVVFAFVLHNMF